MIYQPIADNPNTMPSSADRKRLGAAQARVA